MTDLKNALLHAVLAPAVALAANTNTATIDLQQYIGVCAVVLNAGAASAGTNPTLDVQLYASPNSNAANAVALNIGGNVNFTQVTNANSYQVLAVDTEAVGARYLFAVPKVGGTNSPSFPFAMGIVGQPKLV